MGGGTGLDPEEGPSSARGMQGLPRDEGQEAVKSKARAVAGHVSRKKCNYSFRGAVSLSTGVVDDAAALGGPALAAVFILTPARARARACSGPSVRKESTIGAREEQWETVLETAEEARKVAGRLHR